MPSPNIYGITLVDVPSHTPCFINTTVDGKPAYYLNDLLERHPEDPNLWKVYGRADDLLVLSNVKVRPI